MESLIDKLISNNFESLNKWSLNGTGYFRYNKIKAVRSLLEAISGGEIVEMVRDVLKDAVKDTILIKYLKVGLIVI